MKKRAMSRPKLAISIFAWCLMGAYMYGGFYFDSNDGRTIDDRAIDDRAMSEAAKASLEWTKNGYAGVIAQRLQSGGDAMQMALKNARLAAARAFAAEYMLNPLSPRSMTIRALLLMKQKRIPVRKHEVDDTYQDTSQDTSSPA